MVRDELLKIVSEAVQKAGVGNHEVELDNPANASFGDYSSNIALKVAKQQKMNPVDLAQKIVDSFSENPLIEKVEVMKPGFINIWIAEKYLLENLKSIDENYGTSKGLQGVKTMVEYTDPNPFKEFHIGHLYSNIVGESIARLHEAVGSTVARACYQGDVGLHVAKSIWGMQKKMQEESITLADLEKQALESRAKFMGEAYALGATRYEEDEATKEEIKQLNKKIYEKDAMVTDLYKKGRQWSLEYFELIYARLGTKFAHYFFESEVGPKGIDLVKENLKKGIFKESEGAIVFDGSDYKLHTRVFLNSLGLPTYEAKDLALPSVKYQQFPYDQSIIVTGNEINEYFQVILKVLELISPDLRKKTKHLSHGMVRLPEGKMSSRTGKVITGEWLLDTAKQKAEDIIRDSKKSSDENLENVADIVGIAAIKYALLKNGIGKNVEFNFDESISFEGNSGPYLQYTYVRCRSVLSQDKNTSFTTPSSLVPEEREILRTLIKFPQTVEQAALHCVPNSVCTYLYDLAQKYNLFYQKHSILKSDTNTKLFRLALTAAVSTVLKKGLSILGIKTVEKM